MKHHILAAALTLATTAAMAAPVPVALQGGPDNFTATIRMNHTLAGAFSDEYFITFDGPALVNGQLSATFRPLQQAVNQIVFDDVELDGVDFTTGTRASLTTVTHFALLAPVATNGGFLLRVDGCAGACDGQQQAGTAITASYSGTLNLQRVPEPASLALVLGALGAAGVAGRRRGARSRPA